MQSSFWYGYAQLATISWNKVPRVVESFLVKSMSGHSKDCLAAEAVCPLILEILP